MSRRLDKTAQAGWDANDLLDLQRETQRLLASVRAPSKAQGQTAGRGAASPSNGTTKKGTRRKKGSKETELSKSLTVQFPNTNRIDLGRETVEILDTMSNPASARFSDDDEVEATANVDPSADEAFSRNLEFASEEQRVREGMDTFVPKTGSGLDKLDDERRRLEHIYSTRSMQEMGRAELLEEMEKRKKWLREDRSALILQKNFRGYLGRRRVEVTAEVKAAAKAAQEAWVEVRDQGEVWYFNQTTGESQWEVPEALLSVIPSAERVKRLPALSKATSPRQGSGTTEHSTGKPRSAVSLPHVKGASDVKEGGQAGFRKEVFAEGVTEYVDDDVEGGIAAHRDKQRLFLADGSVNPHLRSTVRDTLRLSRFDSVATLLMGPVGNLVDPAPSVALPPSASGPDRKPVIGADAKKAMVAVLKAKPKRSRPVVGASTAANVKDIRSLTIRDVSHPGFDLSQADRSTAAAAAGAGEGAGPGASSGLPKVGEICFNCWSAGQGKFCAIHVSDEKLEKGAAANGSALMCKNWNLGVLLKRYRSEEIQEVFMRSAASLRYDRERKRFVTVEEQKHPIYRGLSALLSKYNFTVRRKIHQAIWLRSLVEQLRMGKLGNSGKSVGMLRLRNTLFNSRWVRQYASAVAHLHPKGPVTGTTLSERRGIVHHLVCKEDLSFIFALPVPVPVALYLPRVYDLPAPRAIPMPRPSYKVAPTVAAPNAFLREDHPAAWFERFVGRQAREAMAAAALQVAALSPVPGVELLRRTKYPSPQTIKFASLSRKPTPGNRAVGGLAAELTVHELVQTVIPPQFGNYSVMHKTALSPGMSPEATADFDPKPKESAQQVFVPRPLQHALNTRRPPTIMVPTSATEFDKHYYGANRPEQTGEELSHGFRTSSFASGCDAIVVKETNVQAFEPSAEVATPNLPAANQTVTTHVDHTYPFCEPSNRNNTTLDFYHLLLFGSCAPNKEQVFTNFGTQECGEFMKEADITKPLGPCVSHVYRSWAFVQRQMVEEFMTDDGMPYWFDRKSGETFWERPLAAEEKVPVKEGGTVLDHATASDAEGRLEDTKKKYRQDDVRKVILKKHETADDMLDRRKLASQSAKWARDEGRMPAKASTKGAAKKSAAPRQGGPPSGMGDGIPFRGNSGNSGNSGGGVGGSGLGSFDGGNVQRPSSRQAKSAHGPDAAIVESLTQALGSLLPQLQLPDRQMDLLQLGMGIGMSLQGILPKDGGQGGMGQGGMGGVTFTESSMNRPSTHHHREPIGMVEPTRSGHTAKLLDHSTELAQREAYAQIDPNLSTTEQYKGVQAVPTETPDEQMEGHLMHVSREQEAKALVPVFAYPPGLLGKDYATHGVAGSGVSFLPEGQGNDQGFVPESKRTLRRAGDVLPEGFFNAIYSTHVGKAKVDYLPTVPNLPTPKPVGRVKPRSTAEDWFAIGFDPWSAGKDPLSREFIPTLLTKEEALLEQARRRADSSFIQVMDKDGAQQLEAESSENQRLATLFEEMSSFVRHGKYREIEETMNNPEYNLPIDFQDDSGNTLLHVSAQNGNKRVAKLLLRRGATINKQNMAGQTVLHYAQGYGFSELFDYLMSKGADDSLKNADNLTCYEGLAAGDVDAI